MAYRKIVNQIKLNEIESTQDWAKSQFREFATNRWTAISADSQLGGRGQFDANWHDVPGSAILTTWVSPEISWPSKSLWSRQMSVAKLWAETLREAGYPVHIKWPNDIMLGERKLAGMLTEAFWRGHSCYRYFLGIGMNVSDAPPGAAFLGRGESAEDWLERLRVPTAVAATHPLPKIRWQEYTDLVLGWGQWVRWEDPSSGEKIIAKPIDLDYDGRLCVETQSGESMWLRPKSWIWKGLV